MKNILSICLALFCFISCERSSSTTLLHGFYYWKTSMHLDSSAWANMNRYGECPLYVHFFDVDYNAGYGEAVPVGEMHVVGEIDDRGIVPTVFFRNRIFERIGATETDTLAGKLVRKINQVLEGYAERYVISNFNYEQYREREKFDSLKTDWLNRNVDEFQMDCDWTERTRAQYFAFLQAVKKRCADKTLSCTLRLHQYRNRKSAGIPPVDRVMLMCYNTADPKKYETRNAILDPDLVEGYLKAGDYPLKLDIALPLFSWGVWFRDEQFKGLIYDWSPGVYRDTAYFYPEASDRFRLKRDTVVNGQFMREGDFFRLDAVDSTALIRCADLLRPLAGQHTRIVIFDWDTQKMKKHEKLLDACFARF